MDGTEGGESIGKKLEVGKLDKWQKVSKSENRRQEKKERIREAFSNASQVEVIPAKSQEAIYDSYMENYSILLLLFRKKVKGAGLNTIFPPEKTRLRCRQTRAA